MISRTTGARRAMVALLALFSASCGRAGEAPRGAPAAAGAAPDWFLPDPARPHAIFDAWRNLSTREAAVYLHCTSDSAWTVLGGILKDEDGRPMPLVPVVISYDEVMRGYGAQFRTDAQGRFLVYSPYSLKARSRAAEVEFAAMTREESLAYMNQRACEFTACPGYPRSELGFRYAASKGDARPCKAKLIMEAADRAFYDLTCDGRGAFDADGFDRFRKGLMDEHARQEPRPFRDRPRPHEVPEGDLRRTAYSLRVVSPGGKGIPKAIVKFVASGGGAKGNYQVVETGAEGECSVDEYVDVREARALREKVTRELTVDAPGYGVGPVRCALDEGAVNVIGMSEPAAVSGTLVDHEGNPMWADLKVVYGSHCPCPFELCIRLAPDGSFSFERIMPGEPFRIAGGRISRQGTPSAPVGTGYMTLGPGERKDGVRLTVPLASAVRGIVVGEDGAPVGELHDLGIMFEDGSGLGCGEPLGGRFGFSGLGPAPFRIRAEWYTLTDWMTLEPGELRFVRLALEKPSEAHVPLLVKELRDRAEFVREHAASALGRIGPGAREAVPALAAALRDASWRVRQAAAGALGEIGPEARDAVPALAGALEDENRHVRQNAAGALGHIGPGAADAAPALAEMLERGGDGEREVAAWALGRIGPAAEGAVPALAKALRDGNWDVREAAASSLGNLGPSAREAAPALVGLLEDAAPLLTERLWDDYRRTYSAAEGALARIGEAAVPALEGALRDGRPAVRDAAARALEKIRAAQGK